MKFDIKVGNKVAVTKGKFSGKEAVVTAVDKKNKRIQLDSLKKSKSKSKELHGTFHYSSLRLITPPAPKAEEAPAAAPAAPVAEKAVPVEAAAPEAAKE